MVKGVPNQLSLFGCLPEDVPYASTEAAFPTILWTDETAEKEKLAQYLHQGERILSLLREKKPADACYRPCGFLDRFSVPIYLERARRGDWHGYVVQTAIKQARDMWGRNDSADVATNALLSYLLRFLSVEAATEGGSKPGLNGVVDYFFRKLKEKPKGIVTVRSLSRGRDYEVPAGAKSALPKGRHLRLYRMKALLSDYYLLADAGTLFFPALLLCVLKEQVQAAVKGRPADELSDCILYRCIMSMLEHGYSARERASETGQPHIRIGSSIAGRPFVEKVMRMFPDALYSVEEGGKENGLCLTNIGFFLPGWFLSDEEGDVLPFEVSHSVSLAGLKELLEKVCDIYDTERQSHELLHGLKKESAKVYQTKKNISLKCQRAMASSAFNEYFGYVEIDDECDLERFAVVERQFQALSALLFHGERHKEVSIRFRKLGRHHAAGLYYPCIKCLAVDVRNTDSLSHEYFHMLDYERGMASGGYGFLAVRERYKECLLQEIGKAGNEAVRDRLNGRGKYNLLYYLAPTEVFARCGELYLVKVKKVDNSLVKPEPESGFAYPEDEKLTELIKDYFDGFLGRNEVGRLCDAGSTFIV